MKWRPEAEIIRGDETWVCMKGKKKKIEAEDKAILDLMESGITDDDELVGKLAAKLGVDETDSSFRLAQFVVDYGEYLAEGTKSAVFGG
ncbi:MAG: hypothetical protein K5641_07040 [Lachnospiraceae bacterium]|nr:hypothetical protein [Lachnospiraceae bacterium]